MHDYGSGIGKDSGGRGGFDGKNAEVALNGLRILAAELFGWNSSLLKFPALKPGDTLSDALKRIQGPSAMIDRLEDEYVRRQDSRPRT